MSNKNISFTRTMLSIAIPVTLQNLLFSSFTLIDTVMVGSLGDLPLAAVGMAGKWSWFLGVVLYGFTSGASVFIAQYFGAGDERGIHRTYGLMSILSMAVSLLFTALALCFPELIIRFFTQDAAAVEAAKPYLRIIALSYPFLALTRSGSTLLQSTQKVSIPFIAAACSVATNILFNALLIFGLCGFPALGISGAAIASVMATAVNAAVIYLLGIKQKTLLVAPFKRMFDISRPFTKEYLNIAAPAMFNETIWALSYLIYCSIYGHMSTEAYAAITVVKSIEDLTCVAIFGLGSSCAVMIGSMIGRGDLHNAKRCAWYHIVLTAALSAVFGLALIAARGAVMSLFGVSDVVRADASAVMMIFGLELVVHNLPYMMVCGIFRAGGDTRTGLIVDLISAYLIGIPITAAAGLLLHMSVPATYLIMYLVEDVFKVFVYGKHLISNKWIRPVVKAPQTDA
ncbi:MAG: MATE family efflux transporter [Clostridia bacterium]|nr:MATE family efflux transporter [Clostridia bacterium]